MQTPRSSRRTRLMLAVGLFFSLGVASLAAPRTAQAKFATWTLTGSAGFGYEVHPARNVQATNIMAALGLGLLADTVRFELGALAAYGALWAHGPRNAGMEVRPMLRIKPPFIPLYGRLTFAGLLPLKDRANIAYGGALGLNIPLGRLGIMAEVGTLPRRLHDRTHWILEARAGVSVRL